MLDQKSFIVYQGARISSKVSKSGHNNLTKLRNRYSGLVENNVTTENIVFRSPSAAATFICGYSINGKISWKNQFGVTLKMLLEEE